MANIKDVFGHEVFVNDIVAVPVKDEELGTGKVIAICSKTLKIQLLNLHDRIIYRYPFMCAKYICVG